MRMPRIFNGTISIVDALVAIYIGFFLSFSIYETDRGVCRHRILAAVASAPLKAIDDHVSQSLAAVGRIFVGDDCKGVWIDRSSLPQNKRECVELLDRLKELGVTAIFPESFARTAAVCFNSSIAPHDSCFHPKVDLLKIMIEEAHARGIEVHAWCWCLNAGTAYRPGPKVMENPDWLGINLAGTTYSKTGTFWLCPHNKGLPYLKSVFLELATKYDLDGINLDYIRLEENHKAPYCICDTCRDKYFAWVDEDKSAVWPPSPRDPNYLRWRSGLLDGFVGSVAKEVREIRPSIAVSACVLPLAKQAKRLEAQNWRAWLTEGYLDFACALTYTNRPHRNKRWNDIIAGHRQQGLQLIPSVGLHLCKEKEDIAATMISDCLKRELGGVMLFSLRDIPPAVEKTLQTGQFVADTEVAARVGASSMYRGAASMGKGATSMGKGATSMGKGAGQVNSKVQAPSSWQLQFPDGG